MKLILYIFSIFVVERGVPDGLKLFRMTKSDFCKKNIGCLFKNRAKMSLIKVLNSKKEIF